MKLGKASLTRNAKSALLGVSAPIKKHVVSEETFSRTVGNTIEIVIEGVPFSQSRPRLGKKKVRDPSAYLKNNLKWKVALKMRENGLRKLENRLIGVDMIAYLPFPKNVSKRRQMALESMFSINSKKDVDNILKGVLDALNGIAYTDDRYVVRAVAEKRLSSTPRLQLKIYPIHGETSWTS